MPPVPQGASTDHVIFSADTVTRSQVEDYRQVAIMALPDTQTLDRIIGLYYEQIAWFYNPLPRGRLMQLVNRLYSGPEIQIESHELSCVHTILALGHLMDPTKPADSNPQIQHHAKLGRMCLYLECIFAQTTVATIEAHLLRLMFLLFDKDQTAPMKVYGQLGLVWRLMISMGMHRDPARWNFVSEECERRRQVFWEFVAFDTWQCLSWGRPSTIDTKSFDCELPWGEGEHLDDEDKNFHRWKFIYIRDILRDVLALHTMCGIGPTINEAMKLDMRIREYKLFDVGAVMQGNASVPSIYQQNIMFCIKESTLCFLHRPFFVSALNEGLPDPLRSRFAGSCLAIHASASALLGRAPFMLDFQVQTPRFFIWWSQAFSAMVALGALVIKSPGSALAASALTEIQMAAQTFERATGGFRAGRLLPYVRNLRERAQRMYDSFHSGQPLISQQQDDDALPGINSASTVITNAIFPKSSDHSQSKANAVDTLVDDYLRTLQSELDHLAQQRGIAPNQPSNEFGGVDNNHTWQNTAFVPSDSLLSSGLPQFPDSQLQPDFDPAIWTDFMASFGSS
ncbi:SubName: Full=Uncharacterized protein {ECO:0000313/EMBL:CCA77892.1} [Serendipita indica DSM 11827]|nr:SubName: Full=Uncharacterized protein {ECO:0000313/EMBL:CCA77892.1} [Serendipita indica DSM 11827]